jgi:uncharacterized protein (DUF1778 family)
MANIKKITRTEEFKIRMSKEEKELFFKYAESIGINPSRLMRNIALDQANSKIENTMLLPFVKAYKEYLKITDQKERLKEIEEEE